MQRMLNFTVGLVSVLLLTIGPSAAAGVHSVAAQAKVKAPTKNKHYARKVFKAKDGTTINYWLMAPQKIQPGRKYPLVVALHGRGGNTEAATQLGSDILRRRFPCFVMAPVSTAAGHWARPKGITRKRKNEKQTKAMLPAALEAMDALVRQQPIDAQRIYVTGQSMGGGGTFGAVYQRPDTFAAAVPVCGGWNPDQAAKMKGTPIWVFHGGNDKVVPTQYSRDMVAALRKAGGSPKYTEFKGVAHNSWSKTYSDRDMWTWLFRQKRKSPAR